MNGFYIDAIWKYLITASIYGTITGIVILTARFILKNKISKKCMCLLWMIFIFKLIMPYGVESAFSLFNVFSVVDQKIYVSGVFQENVLDGSEENVHISGIESDSDFENSSNKDTNNDFEDIQEENQNKDIINSNLINKIQFIDILKIIWAAVFVIMLSIYFISYMHFKKNVKAVDSDEFDKVYKVFENTKVKMNIKRDIKLIISDNICSPCIIGMFKTKVLIPISLVDLNDSKLEYIFLHELSHYKRKDLLINYVLIILQCMHWFNPVVWFLFKQIKNDIELACDERVLLILDEKEHNKYGLTMLDVIEQINLNLNKKSLGVMNMTDDKKTVKNRIEAIKNNKFLKGKRKIIAITGVICVLLLGIVLLTNSKALSDQRPYSAVLLEDRDDSTDRESISGSVSYINIKDLGYDGYEGTKISKKMPYEASVSYELTDSNSENIKNNLYKDAAIVFSLVKNVDEINYKLKSDKKTEVVNFKKEEVEKELGVKFNTLNKENYKDFILKVSNKVKGYDSLENAISAYLDVDLGIDKEYEFEAEAHTILGQNQKENEFEVYLLYSEYQFEFVNGIFTQAGGSFNIPIRIIICKNDRGEYCFVNATEAEDGEGYGDSVEAMFPRKEAKQALNADFDKEIDKQLKEKAEDYLKSINREAEVITNPVETEEITMNFTDKQYEQFSKMDIDPFLDFIGIYECVENGKRYIYETKNEGEIFNFNKYDESRNLLKTSRVKIDKNNITLLEDKGKNSPYDLSNDLTTSISLIHNSDENTGYYDGTYDIRIRVGNIDKNENIVVAYSLNGDKYEIIGANSSSGMSERVKLIDEVTNKTLKTFYFSGASRNGAYFKTTDDFKKYITKDKYALELQFKIKPNQEPVEGDKILLDVFSYDGEIDSPRIESQKIDMPSKNVKMKKSKDFNLNDFYIEANQ